MKVKINILAAVILSVALVGCGSASKVSQQSYQKVRVGMTEAQADALLGNPCASADNSDDSSIDPGVTVLTWKGNGQTVTLWLLDGKIQSKELRNGENVQSTQIARGES
jgi:hypothetical protein